MDQPLAGGTNPWDWVFKQFASTGHHPSLKWNNDVIQHPDEIKLWSILGDSSELILGDRPLLLCLPCCSWGPECSQVLIAVICITGTDIMAIRITDIMARMCSGSHHICITDIFGRFKNLYPYTNYILPLHFTYFVWRSPNRYDSSRVHLRTHTGKPILCIHYIYTPMHGSWGRRGA